MRISPSCLFLAAALGLAVPEDDWLELPEGPAAKALAAVAPELAPAPWTTPPAGSAEEWSAWSRWLACAAGEPCALDRGEALAALCVFALEHGRGDDAWSWLGAASDEPRWTARVAARLFPGVPRETTLLAGGRPQALPDGVLLTPSIPPAPLDPSGGVRAVCRGLTIGAATVEVELTVDANGAQVDLRWLGGESARVRVLVPTPRGREVRVEYVDWLRQDGVGVPREVTLSAQEPEHTLFGRTLPRARPHPVPIAGALPRSLELGGLWFEAPDLADAERLELEAFARAVAERIGVPVGLRSPAAARPTLAGLTVPLPTDANDRAAVLSWLASCVERHTLQAGQ